MKLFSSKSNAKRALKKIGEVAFQAADKLLNEVDGQWGFDVTEAELVQVAPSAPVAAEEDSYDIELKKMYGHVNCPECGTHLSNGVGDFEQFVELYGKAKAHKMATHEFQCLACGHDFGPEITAPGTGIKIEKNREERNGVVRPSVGGVCRAVWDYCDAIYAKGTMPKPAIIKEAADKNDWNQNNAVIEMYQWRKFMGIRGRQA